jgi:Tol biopolymer transport system component
LYLVEWEDRVKSLFITEYQSNTSRVITPAEQSVAEFRSCAESKIGGVCDPDEERENELWLMDLASMEARQLSNCVDAICSGIVWSPDGTRLIYEHLSLLANSSGLPTLWWIDIATGEEQPVFQESQLPGGTRAGRRTENG